MPPTAEELLLQTMLRQQLTHSAATSLQVQSLHLPISNRPTGGSTECASTRRGPSAPAVSVSTNANAGTTATGASTSDSASQQPHLQMPLPSTGDISVASAEATCMSRALAQQSTMCQTINKVDVSTLKLADVDVMKELRDAARTMADRLDDAIVKLTPCKYNRETVNDAIDNFRHYNFRKFHGLCDHNLVPILDQQVPEAIRAEQGEVALDMLVPLIDFFNMHEGLDDSFGSGSEYVGHWTEKLQEAAELLHPDWSNDDLIKEVLQSVENISEDYFGYGGSGEDLEKVCDKLETFLSTDKPEAKRQKQH